MVEPVRQTVDILREATQCPTCGQCFGRDARFCPFDGVKLGPASYDPLRDALLGTTIEGRYEVLEMLGEGGAGRVYKVRHAALGRLFAMKVLRRDLARDEVIAARFIQEAQATARVRHPHVVEITDYGNLPEGIPFFVTELLRGKTLRDVVREGPMSLPRAIEVVRQVAGGVGAAHGAGIVHRDLKPDNIFLVEGPADATDVRVVDFGAAKVVGASRLTRDGIVYGTPHYMSPEQASGQPVDHRSDIYSLGIIMYEMFTGRVPFEADTYMGVLTQHMFVQPVRPGQVVGGSTELGAFEDITLVCLAKQPEDRYSSMAALSAEIERAWSSFGAAPVSSVHGVEPPRVPSRRDGAAAPAFDAGQRVERDAFRGALTDLEPVFLPKQRISWKWLIFGGIVVVALAAAALSLQGESRNSARPADSVPLATPGAHASTAPPAPLAPVPIEEQPSPVALPASPAPPPTASGATTVRSSPSSSGYRLPAPRRPAQPGKLGKLGEIDDIGDPFAVRR